MADISFLAALVAGVVSFLSPCVLPLVPPYLVYLAGASLERMAGGEPVARARTDTVIASICFVLGFTTVFVALGASATAIGGLIRAWSGTLATVAGIVIIIMGLHFLGVTRLAFLMQEKRVTVSKPVSLWGAYVMGLAFAFGWTPCIGPILAAILAVAASESTVTRGASLLAVYSLGLGIPFVVAAFAIQPFAAFLARFRTHLHRVEQVMGVLLIITGIAFLTGTINNVSYWLLEAFPALGRIG
ncbi:MAG: sulfite exporter TauE/SafE family protein [Rhizobiales bacterium]|nr:sulfite exporter TauE/SafE family protein [Hyphomicrobiales bacterium]OJY41500.1 MAG: cytochrome C biogenesis protein [Rhizobiales bacterium 64-17]